MAHTDRCTRSHSAAREMLIHPAHIDHAGDGRIIAQGYFAMRREKKDTGDRVIEVLWNAERLHILDPASAAGMHWIANFVLTLQHQRARALAGGSFGGREARRPAAHNQ